MVDFVMRCSRSDCLTHRFASTVKSQPSPITPEELRSLCVEGEQKLFQQPPKNVNMLCKARVGWGRVGWWAGGSVAVQKRVL